MANAGIGQAQFSTPLLPVSFHTEAEPPIGHLRYRDR